MTQVFEQELTKRVSFIDTPELFITQALLVPESLVGPRDLGEPKTYSPSATCSWLQS